MGLLIETGYDCIHPVDTQGGPDLYELREGFGEKVSFMGHIDLMSWGKERICSEVGLAENEFRNGGLILGSTGGISMDLADDALRTLYPWDKRGEPYR